MKRMSLFACAFLAACAASALDLFDLMKPDDVKPARARAAASPADAALKPAVRSAPAPRAVAPAPVASAPAIVVKTNVVTLTDRVTKTDYVTKTNFVTRTDFVTHTNVVTKTDYVVETNRVTHTDYVTKTNLVTQRDYVIETNRVTHTDYVTKTNVVIEKRIDPAERIALENQRNKAYRDAVVERSARESAEQARGAAEKKAVAAQVARVEAEAEVTRMREALARADEARRLAEARLKAAETKVAVAEKKAAAADQAREEVAAQVDAVARTALAERKARERAEAERRAADIRAEAERHAALLVAKKLDAVTNAPPPTVETADYAPDLLGPEKNAATNAPGKAARPAAPKLTGRDAIITAERMDYDRKEGVILFDRNVYVDDEQYQMHADRLFVFLETNAVSKVKGKTSAAGSAAGERKTASRKKADRGEDMSGLTGGNTSLKRLVAIGHVSITNEQRTAYCARATYAKKSGKIVMYGSDEITPWILDPEQSKTPQYGEKITFWTISSQVEVEKPVLSGAALGKGKGANPLEAMKK